MRIAVKRTIPFLGTCALLLAACDMSNPENNAPSGTPDGPRGLNSPPRGKAAQPQGGNVVARRSSLRRGSEPRFPLKINQLGHQNPSDDLFVYRQNRASMHLWQGCALPTEQIPSTRNGGEVVTESVTILSSGKIVSHKVRVYV